MREDFRPILGYEGHYEINSEGVVISLKYGKRRVLKGKISNRGYRNVLLTLKGKGVMWLNHRLVWEAFNGPIPEGMFVLHGPGNERINCSLEYLTLGDAQANSDDKRRDGTMRSVLTEVQVRYIKQRLADGMKLVTLGKLFGVCYQAIQDIKNGRNWSHVA